MVISALLPDRRSSITIPLGLLYVPSSFPPHAAFSIQTSVSTVAKVHFKSASLFMCSPFASILLVGRWRGGRGRFLGRHCCGLTRRLRRWFCSCGRSRRGRSRCCSC